MRESTWQTDADSSGTEANNALLSAGSDLRARVPRRWTIGDRLLNCYAIFCTAAVLALICVGGMVTSKEAGMTVPDWPNSYGYNMFAFPISRWVGGIFWEHFHRLSATGIGVLTIGLAVWLWLADQPRWMRWLGTVAVGAVVFQGVLGGLRVVLRADWIGILHACFAQAFILLIAFIALATTRWWRDATRSVKLRRVNTTAIVALRTTFLVLAGMIYLQLALGASMRHAHAGLSIRDFPTAYGKWWPATDAVSMERINHERTETLGMPRTSVAQIHLQMTHRIGAGAIAIGVCVVAFMTWRRRASLPSSLAIIGMVGPVLVTVQITLGIYTIWTNKAADVATMHVAVGAITLLWATLTGLALHRWAKQTGASAAIPSGMISQRMEVAV